MTAAELIRRLNELPPEDLQRSVTILYDHEGTLDEGQLVAVISSQHSSEVILSTY